MSELTDEDIRRLNFRNHRMLDLLRRVNMLDLNSLDAKLGSSIHLAIRKLLDEELAELGPEEHP